MPRGVGGLLFTAKTLPAAAGYRRRPAEMGLQRSHSVDLIDQSFGIINHVTHRGAYKSSSSVGKQLSSSEEVRETAHVDRPQTLKPLAG